MIKVEFLLFGDCGTAIALEYDENASDIYIDMETYGEGHSALITPHSGFRHQVTPESLFMKILVMELSELLYIRLLRV